jgi:hypothetical protein
MFLFCAPDYLILDQGGEDGLPVHSRIVALSHCRIAASFIRIRLRPRLLPISHPSIPFPSCPSVRTQNVLCCNTVKSVRTTYAIPTPTGEFETLKPAQNRTE